jgi:integrase
MIDLKSFKDWLLIQGSAQASATTHCDKVAMYFRQYNELSQENFNSFLSNKLSSWNGSSFNLFLNAIKHYAKFLNITLEFPPYRKLDTKIKAYITEKELNDILDKLPILFKNANKIQVMLLLMFELGLRPKELKNLKREHFDLEKKNVLISKTKVYRDRSLPLSDKLCKLIFNIFQQETEDINAFNITTQGLEYIFRQIKTNFNLQKEFTPYTMRNSYAHNLIQRGLKLTSLQIGLGHKNISTTLGYLKVSDEEANNEIRNILNKRRKK